MGGMPNLEVMRWYRTNTQDRTMIAVVQKGAISVR